MTDKSNTVENRITCMICGEPCHAIHNHIHKSHPEMTVEEYHRQFPDAPLLSEFAKNYIMEKRISENKVKEVQTNEPNNNVNKMALDELFGLTEDQNARNKSGNRIMISIFEYQKCDQSLIPDVNDNYVYDTNQLKEAMYAREMNIPCYIWGHKGCGKSELIEQICARTRTPMMRVQHTINTEESQIVGQWVVRNGQTEFELGPLPTAMMNGWLYCADEYDFALPNVTAAYQSVLEGKPLVIKEAPANLRVIRPHPAFRFFATGNTNGTGDETGLYQGTNIQNSANFDRFGVVINKTYMDEESEKKILQMRCGIDEEDSADLVKFANMIRRSYSENKISDTISPRTLITAANIGIAFGSFKRGLELSFLNKLSSADKIVCEELAQRIYAE